MNIRNRIVAISTLTLLLALGANFAAGQSGYDLYQQALQKERVEGKLAEAIQLYRRIIKDFAKDRALAAKALFQLGACHEKQGNAEARRIFERVVKEYADQGDMVALAHTRLAALSPLAAIAQNKELSIRRINFPYYDGAPSPDGRYIGFADDNNELSILDLDIGTTRKIVKKISNSPKSSYGDMFWGGPVWSHDGKKLSYLWMNAQEIPELRIINADGSNQRTIMAIPKSKALSLYGWFPDGQSLFCAMRDSAVASNALVRIQIANGALSTLRPISDSRYSTISNMSARTTYHLSPDGKFIAAQTYNDQNQSWTISLFSISGGSETDLSSGKNLTLAGWDFSGSSVLFTSDRSGSLDLWRIPITNGRPEKELQLIKSNVDPLRPLGFTSRGFYYSSLSLRGRNIDLAIWDRETGVITTIQNTINKNRIGSSAAPAWSPDGNRLAYLAPSNIAEKAGFVYSTLCLWSLKEPTPREITLSIPLYIQMARFSWAADGLHLFGVQPGDGISSLIQINSNTGQTQVRTTVNAVINDWTQDGNTVFAHRYGAQDEILFAQDSSSGRETQLFYVARKPMTSTISAIASPLSPDNRWYAFTQWDERDGRDIYRLKIIPSNGGTPREIYICAGGNAFWAPDSKHIWCVPLVERGRAQWMVEVSIEDGTVRNVDQMIPTTLFRPWFHPDGKQILKESQASGQGRSAWLMENLPPIKAPN